MNALMASVALAASLCGAEADLKVLETQDVVELFDGTEVQGTVIAVGLKAVVMVVEDKEKMIPRARVRTIRRGEVLPAVRGYATEVVEGMKRITGPGDASTNAAAPAETPAGPGAQGEVTPPGGTPVVTKELIEEKMKTHPGLVPYVTALGGPENAAKWIEKNKSDPKVREILDQLLKSGKLPSGMPLMVPPVPVPKSR